MGLTNIKHRIYGGLGRIGVPLLILALFTWGVKGGVKGVEGVEGGRGGRGTGTVTPQKSL